MALGADVRAYLLSKSAVTNVIGTRLYPGFVPQKNSTYPCIVYQVISSSPQHHLGGGAGFAHTRIQFDIYSTTAATRDSLADVLRDQLQGFPSSTTTMGNSTVTSVTAEVGRDLYETPQDNSDTGLFRFSVDYWFRHNQAVPTYAA